MTLFTNNELQEAIDSVLDSDLMWHEPETIQKIVALRAKTSISDIELASQLETLILPF